ncbi:MAG: DctP family TRAP transporter solute-binding subunit [Peptococcaceae bacterium]|jgi:tripartite ATP-independent transporter DctP family solute receptor|nr:DctP family TRAP transporter solute-binding subunit [Peptococcaceae bacterium]
MKKIFVLFTLMTLVMTILVGCGSKGSSSADSSGSKYEKLKLKMSTSGTDKGIDAIAGKYMANKVKELSGGNIIIDVYPNAQLTGGNQAKGPELLAQGGSFELGCFSGANLSSLDERFQTHQIPFTFASYAEAIEKMDSTGGKYYAKILDEKGIVYLAGMHNGLRQLTNSKREIKAPEDLKGLKIRIPSGEVGIKVFKTFGADPVAMNWSEVFTALQQGTIDGQENGYQTLYSAHIHEVQKYLTEWNWQYDGWWFVANKKSWESFSQDTRGLLMQCAIEAAKYGRDYLEKQEKEIKQIIAKDYGVKITELSPEKLQVFKDAVQPVRKYFIEKYGEEACKAWGVIK